MPPDLNQEAALAEAISLLHLLHRIPATPFSNPEIPDYRVPETEYSLPFAKEQTLVHALSFLVGNDDPNYVPALCVQEEPNANGPRLNILLAVNQRNSNDTDAFATLKEIKDKFDPLLASLQDAPQRTEQELFTHIVSMCTQRILVRIRYAKSKSNKQKQTIKHLLTTTTSLLGAAYFKYKQAARVVVKNIDNWLKYQTTDALCIAVESIHTLSRVPQLRPALDSIANIVLGPSERKNLLRMILRVARYRETARVLYRLAKKYPITRNMCLVLVTLPTSAFRGSSPSYKPSLERTSERLSIAKVVKSNTRLLSRLLIKNGNTIDTEFDWQALRIMREGKIHAEVQLVYHLETHEQGLPPRVIASSKMACYLCNVFLCSVAKIYTRRCHGRLYPGWKLPFFPSSCDMERRFTRTLETKIQQELPRLVKSQKRTVFPDPSESALWTMNESATTIAQPETSVDIVEEVKTDDITPEIKVDEVIVVTECPPEVADVIATTSSEDTLGPPALSEVRMKLRQGTPLDLKLPVNSLSTLHLGPAIFQIEYTVGPNSTRSELQCCAEWLKKDSAAAVKVSSVDLLHSRDLELGIETEVANDGPVHVDIGGKVLRLVLS
ncbi:hypothetical protein VHEMI08925 [[Torrubiella] hemipterigena]|uniref:Uncharacterized protein n=1 Tax=[Torrubiella] hemipterigena TaxID=1531966 RepID=A0A0A1TQK9_9HYPO|nr:hypothetical protein VHEMI08925 [[Torrubiella] hemipterigena]